MKDYFECVVTYDKACEDGVLKKTSEAFLFEAVSHADAENMCIEKVTPEIAGEYLVTSVKRRKFSEIVEQDGERFYVAKVSLITIDEKSAKEKITTTSILVQADTIHGVLKTIEELFDQNDYEVVSVSKSQILDVFHEE